MTTQWYVGWTLLILGLSLAGQFALPSGVPAWRQLLAGCLFTWAGVMLHSFLVHVTNPRLDQVTAPKADSSPDAGASVHAPHWPAMKYNGHFTLRRGVWVDDTVAVPADDVLDRALEAYARSHRQIVFSLVEGEQDAPMGGNGRIIRVRATHGTPVRVTNPYGEVRSTWPTVQVTPVDAKEGTWSSTYMGTFPLEMSLSVQRDGQ